MTDRPDTADTDAILRTWRDALLDDLAQHDPGLEGTAVDIDAVLGLAGTVAHAVVRPAAPLTAYLVGLAAGSAIGAGRDGEAAFADAVARARALADTFRTELRADGSQPSGS